MVYFAYLTTTHHESVRYRIIGSMDVLPALRHRAVAAHGPIPTLTLRVIAHWMIRPQSGIVGWVVTWGLAWCRAWWLV